MALVSCRICTRQISTTAIRCPSCGSPGPAATMASAAPTVSSNAPTESLAHATPAHSPGRESRLRTSAQVFVLVVLAILVLRWIHGSGSSAERYFPLKQGLTWKYRVSATLHSLPVSGEATVANLDPRGLLGTTVVPQTTDITFGTILGIGLPKTMGVSFYGNDQYGIREVAHQESTDVEPKARSNYILKYPIEMGTQWTDNMKTQVLKPGTPIALANSIVTATDQVIVPAGSYQNCVRVKSIGKTIADSSGAFVSAEENAWFARGVGLVKQIYTESASDTSDKQTLLLELEEFKQ